MDTTKLKVALDDLVEQRNTLDAAIQSLQEVLLRFNGHPADETNTMGKGIRRITDGYLDLTVKYLERTGKPAMTKQIVNFIKQYKANPKIKRNSIEATLARHIQAKGAGARIIKLGRGIWGLPTHAQKPLMLEPSESRKDVAM
jgi:hypothetical protein